MATKTTKTKALRTKKEVNPRALDTIISPRITEKGAISAEHNAYIFNVRKDATKSIIAEAIEHIYKVKPLKITVVNSPVKKVFAKGKRGTKGGGKKAYVFLKKGEQIQVI